MRKTFNEVGFASLDVAYSINDQGWITGYGTTSDNLKAAFVAVPERSGGAVVRQAPASPPRGEQQLQIQDLGRDEEVPESDESDYDVFYSQLSSQGSWVEAGDYGYCF